MYFSIEHDAEMNVLLPTLIPTPYGGRLVWQLPGGNYLVAHLKDKVLIRHRKRWSQVGLLLWNSVHKVQVATTSICPRVSSSSSSQSCGDRCGWKNIPLFVHAGA